MPRMTRGDGCIVHTSRILATCPTHGIGVTKPKGGMATKLMGLTLQLGALIQTVTMLSPPTFKTRALNDFQTGMGGNPNRTPAESRLKIQTKWSYKKNVTLFLAYLS